MKTVLINCTAIDCTGKPPMKDMTVIIEDEKIAALKAGAYQQAAGEGEVRVLDLEGGYVLPGLWNVHAHLGHILPDPKHLMASESVVGRAIRVGRNAMDALRVGITGMRVVGEDAFIDVAWKRAFDAGVFVGPRLFVCGKFICATGAHGRGAVEVNGPYEMRKAVRENLKHGVDQIKICVPHGESELLLDEVKAATEAAHQKGRLVSAHCVTPWVKVAMRGGVDCIEHGYYLDDETIEMMVENDVFYVPTICCTQEQLMFGSGRAEVDLDAANRALQGRALVAKADGVAREYAKVHLEGFQKALKAGVKIACGGHIGPSGEFTLVEIEHLVRAGMSEMHALIAATRNSADLCGVLDRLGTVEVGKLADLIVVSANPLENICNIRKLKLVLKDGKLVETREPEGLADYWELFYF